MTGRATAAKVFAALVSVGVLAAVVKHHAFAAAVLQGKCPYLAKVVPELKPFVERAEKGFATLAQCDEFEALVDKWQHDGDTTKKFIINGEELSDSPTSRKAACAKLGFHAAELREAFKLEHAGFLLHGYGYTKSDSTTRTHVTVKSPPCGRVMEITTDSSEPSLTSDLDVAAKAPHPGVALVMDALSKYRSDCEDFGELLHDEVLMWGGKYHGDDPTAHSQAEAIEACKTVNAKMDRIETLNFQSLVAAVPGVSKDGTEQITVILEKTSQVKYSPKIMTSPIAIDIKYKDGKITHLANYVTEARGLVQKYGDRYAASPAPADENEQKPFMRQRFWEKKDGDKAASPKCSKFTAKGPWAVRGCEMCLARDQPIEECLTCGGKCIKQTCSNSEDFKECFGEVMKDRQKRSAVKECYKECMHKDEPEVQRVEEVEEEDAVPDAPEFKPRGSRVMNAHLHLDAFELDLYAEDNADEQP